MSSLFKVIFLFCFMFFNLNHLSVFAEEKGDLGFRFNFESKRCERTNENGKVEKGYNPEFWGECGDFSGMTLTDPRGSWSPTIKFDLIGVNFTGATIVGYIFSFPKYLNFTNATLKDTGLVRGENFTFINSQLTGVRIEGLENSNFGNVKATNSIFRDLSHVIIENSEFNNTDFKTTYYSTISSQSTFLNSDFDGSHVDLRDVTFKNGNIQLYHKFTLLNSEIIDSIIDIDLEDNDGQSTLKNTTFKHLKFEYGSYFKNIKFDQVDFICSDFYDSTFLNSDLRGLRVSPCEENPSPFSDISIDKNTKYKQSQALIDINDPLKLKLFETPPKNLEEHLSAAKILFKYFYSEPDMSWDTFINVHKYEGWSVSLKSLKALGIIPRGKDKFWKKQFVKNAAFLVYSLFDPELLPISPGGNKLTGEISLVKELKVDWDGRYKKGRISLNMKYFHSFDPSLYEVLVHEIGHNIHHKKVRRLSKKWEKLYRKDQQVVTDYGETSIKENFAESVMAFFFDPLFKCYSPQKFEFISKLKLINTNIFGDKKPFSQVDCSNSAIKEKLEARKALNSIDIRAFKLVEGRSGHYPHISFDSLIKNPDFNIHVLNEDSETLLIAALRHKRTKLISKMLEQGIDINHQDILKNTALHYAARWGYQNAVKTLLNKGANQALKNSYFYTPYDQAKKEGHALTKKALLKHLLGSKTTKKNYRDKDGNTPLHISIIEGWNRHAEKLVEKGWWTNVKNKKNETPIILAVKNGEKKVTRALLKYQPDLNSTDLQKRTALHYACKQGYKNTLKIILKSLKKLKSENKITLKEKQSILNYQDKKKKTALHYCAQKGYNRITKLLLTAGANQAIKDSQNLTPIEIAQKAKYNKTENILLEYLMNPSKTEKDFRNKTGDTPLHLAIRQSWQNHIEKFLSSHKWWINTRNNKAQTPIVLAVIEGEKKIVKILVKENVDLSLGDSGGKTALHHACVKDYGFILEILLEKAKDNKVALNRSDHSGKTALHYCAENGKKKMVRRLLGAGANKNKRDHDGYKPSHYSKNKRTKRAFK